MVRASITREPDGAPGILLYGLVASDSGKRNAEAEAAALLADSGIEIADVILIRPQLASISPNDPDTSKEPDAADASGQFDSAAQSMLQQYQNQDDNGGIGRGPYPDTFTPLP
jgi:hypothetical protein